MAKSGRFGASFQQASDMEYDYICSSCEDEDLNAEARFYCKQCCKQYCVGCVVYHRKLHKGHTVLGKDQVKSWGEVKKDDYLEMCEEHDGERLKTYCGDHDDLCCHMCISLKHRSCKVVKQISEVAKGIHKKTEFKKLPTNITKTLSDLNEIKVAKVKNSKTLLDSRKDFLSKIKKLRTSVDQMFDDIEKRTIQELDNHLDDTAEGIQEDVQTCTQFHDELQKLHTDIQDKGQNNEIAGYIGSKKCAKKMTSAGTFIKNVNKQDYTMAFDKNRDIKKYVANIKTFGQFTTSPNRTERKSLDGNSGQAEGNASSNRNSKTSNRSAGTTSKDSTIKSYKVNSVQKYNVKVNTDNYDCDIYGICQLPNGNIVITDQNNKKLKLLDDHYTVTCHCDLPSVQWGICHIKGDEVAVTVCDYTVQFVSTRNGKLNRTRDMKFNHECVDIKYNNDQLYVSSGTALYIYTMLGQLLEKLYEDESDVDTVNCFTVSSDSSKIYISDYANDTLITLDNKSNKLATFQDPDLDSPEGVCVADNNTVLVCNSNTILQVDREGQHKLSILATESDGVNGPISLLVNKKTGELIVGQFRGNDLLVLKLA